MAQSKIQLRKIRDFGDNISDTFQFIRQEGKSLVLSFLVVGGIFMFINAIVSGIYQKQTFGFMDSLSEGIFNPEQTFSMFTPMYFAVIILSVVTYSAMITVVAVYTRFCDEENRTPSTAEVWQSFSKYIVRTIVFGFLQSILVIIGLVMCIIPGIYLLVVFLPAPFIIVHENLGISDTFNRCFTINRQGFWQSLGIYLVAGIISSVVSGILGVLLGIVVGLGTYFSSAQMSTVMAIVMSVVSVVQYFFYLILFIAVALQYYNLVEQLEGTGLERRISLIGDTKQHRDNSGMEF